MRLFIPYLGPSTNAIYAGLTYTPVVTSKKVSSALGYKFYFDGKKCSRGHTSPRYIKGRQCASCSRESRERNREKAAQTTRKWRADNPERQIEMSRAAYRKNRDREVARRRVWRENNKEYSRAKNKEWRSSNREYIYQKNKKYVANNIEANRNYWRNSRAKRIAKIKSGVESRDLTAWVEAQEKVCFWCGVDVSDGFHIDHYIPLSRGGEHELHNLRVSCESCNLRKHAKMPEEFMRHLSEGDK